LVAFFIAALSVVLLASSLARMVPARRLGERAGTPGRRKEGGSGGAGAEQALPVAWKVVLPTAAAIVAYAALLDRVGFFATTFLFVLGFSYAFARSKPLQLLVAAAGFTAALYVIFVGLFRVPAPPGIAGF
ncbi:MAG: tripartite tricarboxylate transporter TctB family protein, partial [Bacillota bacterium]